MRVNIYAEEMTDRVELVEKVIDGKTFTGVRFYLELPVTTEGSIITEGKSVRGPFLHGPGDDDSAAVTFFGKAALRTALQRGLELLERHDVDEEGVVAVPGGRGGRPLTLGDVENAIEEIALSAGDYERAHGREDQLHQEVLRAIADGNAIDPRACAALALTSAEIEFSRYCA